MTKSIALTSHELTEVYYALAKRVEYYEECYDLKDANFRSEYSGIYSSYLNAKSALKKIESKFFE